LTISQHSPLWDVKQKRRDTAAAFVVFGVLLVLEGLR